ncbi:hypothetical protein O181_108610, partial [Austropuccinia psidii MF-1]|nr:hypothetical protein [Austropuccinia psidii MF-1]
MEIQEEAENEHKFILTEEEFPWEGYKNWKPLRNSSSVGHNKNNFRDNFECANQHVKWLEDISKPKKNESEKITDKRSKEKKKTKEETEYFGITQKKKICPSLQAHFGRQYKTSTQKEDWTVWYSIPFFFTRLKLIVPYDSRKSSLQADLHSNFTPKGQFYSKKLDLTHKTMAQAPKGS